MVTLGTNTIKNTVTAQAPDEIPVIYGSAKGFLITACKSTPEIARLAPISTAIITLGILKSFIIPTLPVLSPDNIPLISSVKLQSEFDPKAIDLLVPVPSSGDRMRKRGYNQAALLGRVISGKTGIPLREDLLLRTGSTGAMRNLSASERRRNLKSAFIVPDIDVKSVVIMLVDDIFTTGATADACAQTLLRAGAAEVLVLTAAAGDDRS